MHSSQLTATYRRYGPLLFSHFRRALGDEEKAVAATRESFATLAQQQDGLDDQRVVAFLQRQRQQLGTR
jgi:hypothetical protein